MKVESVQEKQSRRRKKLIGYHIAITGGYAVTQAAFLLARALGLCTVDLTVALTFSAVIVGFPALSLIGVALSRTPSAELGVKVSYVQFLWWMLVYAIWVYLLNEMRLMGLFFALMPLTLLLTSTSFYQTLYVAIGAVLIHVGVTYYAIQVAGQTGNFLRELFITLTFAPSALYLAYLSRLFQGQRNDIKKGKRDIEAALERVWSEMDVAKKIQTVLLPVDPKLEGYSFAAHMDVAEQVGGDYYDVVRCRDRNWLVIGDVSGHGVTAGLVMMMVQTAIHTVLDEATDRQPPTPSELLVRINRTIHDNIQKMGESKYMTLTAMLLGDDGLVTHAGLHQDMLVYRADSEGVETIETTGAWIGMIEHIDGMLDDHSFRLNVGDVLVTYTDGITEAREKATPKRYFGPERLERLVGEHGAKSPQALSDALVRSLEGYTTDDDVTFMILRRDR